MKLFPEQNGNLLNSLQSKPSSTATTTVTTAPPPPLSSALQAAAASIPILLQEHHRSKSPIKHHSMDIAPQLVDFTTAKPDNLTSKYPHVMDCDPPDLANPSDLRYNFLLSGLAQSASSNALLNTTTSSSGPMSHHMHLNRNSKSATNVLQNYAPNSLPTLYGSGNSNNGTGQNDSLAAIQHHLLSSGIGPTNNVTYIPYSMSGDTTSIPKNNSSTMASSSSLSSS